MTDSKRHTRREPITTIIETPNGDVSFVAHPLPWRVRIKYGEAVSAMYGAALDSELQLLRDDEGKFSGITGGLFEARMDYPLLFDLGYSTWKIENDEPVVDEPPSDKLKEAFGTADFDAMIEVLDAVLRVNGLERISHLLDPDRKALPLTGASESATEETTSAGEKMESPSDSG